MISSRKNSQPAKDQGAILPLVLVVSVVLSIVVVSVSVVLSVAAD